MIALFIYLLIGVFIHAFISDDLGGRIENFIFFLFTVMCWGIVILLGITAVFVSILLASSGRQSNE